MRYFTPLAFLLCLTLTTPSLAQTSSDLLNQGKAEFEAGNYDTAYDLLEKAFFADPTNLDISFLLGQSAYAKGDYEAALMAYERVLIMTPDADRVKLELARTNLKLGSREMAKQYFREVLATNPPQQVVENINNMLAAIAAGEKNHFFNGIFTTSYNLDSNANGTPSDGILYLYGTVPVTLSQDKLRDQYYGEQAILNHIYRIQDTPYSWKSTATLYGNFYENQNTQDTSVVALSTGPVKQTDKYMWATNLSVANIESAYARYMGSIGIASTLTTAVNKETILNFSVSLQDRNYYLDGDKDSTNLSVSGGVTFIKGQNRLTITGTREQDRASADYNSYQRTILDTRYDRELPLDFSAFAGLRFQFTDYREALEIFGMKRQEDQIDFTMGVSRLLWKADDGRYSLAGQLSHTHTDIDANISIYGYKKDVTSASLTLAF
ncbi:MAG: tetratricopeptide repeat protein [Desulfobulbaceae bacterium]|nr:tetratricopeptide repeat protein [Desulfobulbaceae bacterium]